MADNCRDCQTDISELHPQTQFCGGCRLARARNADKRKIKYCWKCGKPYFNKFSRNCEDCWPRIWEENRNWEDNSGKQQAHGLVARAKKSGFLPDLKKVRMKCDDCGKRAIEFDHRDYNYPLLVSPVCRSCNLKRGSAIPHRDYSPVAS